MIITPHVSCFKSSQACCMVPERADRRLGKRTDTWWLVLTGYKWMQLDHECFGRKFFQAVRWRGLIKVQIIWKNGTAKAWTSSQVQSRFSLHFSVSTQIWYFCAMSWVLYTRVPLHNLVVLIIRILYFCLARSCRRWWYWKDNLCQTSLDWRIWKKICWWVTYVIITSFRNFHRIRDTVCLNLTQNHVSIDISFILR